MMSRRRISEILPAWSQRALFAACDSMGWCCCEASFRLNAWLDRGLVDWDNELKPEPFWYRRISWPLYRLGCWLYGVRP